MAAKKKRRVVKKTEEKLEQPIVVAAEEVTVKDMTGEHFRLTKLTFILPVVVLFIVVLAGGGYYLYTVKQKTTTPANEAQTLVEQIGKLLELPKGESPTVATVTDVNKLQNQQFFTRAQNGDKVLIYQQAKRAILYRPTSGKIIEVGPVALSTTATPAPKVAGAASNAASPGTIQNLASLTPTASPSPSIAQPLKIALVNGTKTNGLTRQAEKDLTDKGVLIEVVSRGNARKDYAETIIIVLSGTSEQGKAVAQALSATVASLPEGEEEPDADILVILGKDYADK